MLQLVRQGLPPELVQPLRSLPLLLFVALGISVLRAPEGQRRRRIQRLLAAFLLFHAGAVLLQFDAWPFSPYRMMAVDARAHADVRSMVAFRAVDRAGREWTVDPLSWSPLFPQAIMGWFETALPRAKPTDRDAAAQFLFQRVEDARRRRLAGRRVGNERLLGCLAAPDTNLSRSLEGLPPEPFAVLRVYRLFWRPDELNADPSRFGRRLLLEYRAP